ncbi:hypothetical protein SAMN05518855_1002166 [Paenibacillus sp. CF384]|nr:hypothetical protein SAMN05518855_1002166 [Paenibacillus sp. CF384]
MLVRVAVGDSQFPYRNGSYGVSLEAESRVWRLSALFSLGFGGESRVWRLSVTGTVDMGVSLEVENRFSYSQPYFLLVLEVRVAFGDAFGVSQLLER